MNPDTVRPDRPFSPGVARLLRAALALVLVTVTACDDDGDGGVQPPAEDNFSNTVLPILQQSCATAGCHDAASAAAGLVLTSYESTMAGSEFGEAVIPFSASRSLMIELLEGRAASGTVDHSAGSVLGAAPGEGSAAAAPAVLGAEAIDTLRDWVADGCPDDSGTPAFAGVTSKIYVTGQRADLISVISVEDRVVMRLIGVESFPGGSLTAQPHFGVFNPDDDTWFVTMLEAPGLWQFTSSDTLLATLQTNLSSPALAVVTPDGTKAYVTHFIDPQAPGLGLVSVVDLPSFQVVQELHVLNTPHGIAISGDGSQVYVANFGSDHITVIDTADDSVVDHIPVSESVRGNINSFQYRVIQVASHPTLPLVYVGCTATNEVRVIDVEVGTVVDSLSVGAGAAAPWHVGLTPDGSKLYAANRGQQLQAPELLPGSVSVFSTEPFQLLAQITDDSMWLTHGVGFDATGRYCFVSSENLNGRYTARHPIESDDPPGTVAIIDTATDQVVKVLEVEAFATGVFGTP